MKLLEWISIYARGRLGIEDAKMATPDSHPNYADSEKGIGMSGSVAKIIFLPFLTATIAYCVIIDLSMAP